jgi:single-strand DNA-binding protein
MSLNSAQVVLCGNAVADPELRFTPSGAAVVNFRIACNDRRLNRQTQEWEDGDTAFVSVTAWRQVAENIAESVQRGYRVVVVGRLKTRQYETREGEKRISVECDADEVAVSLRNATAKVQKMARQGSGSSGGSDPWGGQPSDPWASQPPANRYEEPPF